MTEMKLPDIDQLDEAISLFDNEREVLKKYTKMLDAIFSDDPPGVFHVITPGQDWRTAKEFSVRFLQLLEILGIKFDCPAPRKVKINSVWVEFVSRGETHRNDYEYRYRAGRDLEEVRL